MLALFVFAMVQGLLLGLIAKLFMVYGPYL